jgi:hypothetical protein
MTFTKQTGYCKHCGKDVLLYKGKTRHFAFLILSLFTAFILSPIWIIATIINNIFFRCSECHHIVKKSEYKETIQTEDIPEHYKELNGLLYVYFVFVAIIIPLGSIINVILSIYFEVVANKYEWVYLICGLANILITIVSILSGVYLVKKKRVSIIFSRILFLILILLPTMFLFIISEGVNDGFMYILLFNAFVNIIFSIIWLTYFIASKRVKIYFSAGS